MKKLGIVAALREELQPLADGALVGSRPTEHAGDLYLVSGIGKVNAARAVTELHYKGATHILLVGTCAALNPDTPLFLTYLVDRAMQHDYGVRHDAFLTRSMPGEFPGKEAWDPWLYSARELYLFHRREVAPPSLAAGRMATGDQHIAAPALTKELRARYRATCVDMETGAVAQACHSLGLPWIAVKTVSDHAEATAVADFATNLSAAVARNSEHVRGFVAAIKAKLWHQ